MNNQLLVNKDGTMASSPKRCVNYPPIVRLVLAGWSWTAICTRISSVSCTRCWMPAANWRCLPEKSCRFWIFLFGHFKLKFHRWIWATADPSHAAHHFRDLRPELRVAGHRFTLPHRSSDGRRGSAGIVESELAETRQTQRRVPGTERNLPAPCHQTVHQLRHGTTRRLCLHFRSVVSVPGSWNWFVEMFRYLIATRFI